MADQVEKNATGQADRKFTVLSILVAGLLVAVIAQSVVIFQMHRKMARSWETPAQTAITAPKGHHKAAPPTAALPSPFDNDKDFFLWGTDEWDPFKEMHSMQDRINQMFGNAFNKFQDSDDFGTLFRKYSFSPDVNVEDKGENYLVTVDLPGSDESHLDVKLEGQKLTVSGSVQSESKQTDKGKVLRQERRSGKFERVVTLPGPVKADKMTTTNKAGVVYITIPKATS